MIRTTETELRAIACECEEFDHVIQAMGYGYSLLLLVTAGLWNMSA